MGAAAKFPEENINEFGLREQKCRSEADRPSKGLMVTKMQASVYVISFAKS
jgi:hypothetical protein